MQEKDNSKEDDINLIYFLMYPSSDLTLKANTNIIGLNIKDHKFKIENETLIVPKGASGTFISISQGKEMEISASGWFQESGVGIKPFLFLEKDFAKAISIAIKNKDKYDFNIIQKYLDVYVLTYKKF